MPSFNEAIRALLGRVCRLERTASRVIDIELELMTSNSSEPTLLRSVTIGSLPPELLLLIRDHSNNASAACLALTCRNMYTVLRHTYFPLSKDDRKEFMLIIQRDISDRYLCHHCLTFHKFTKEKPGNQIKFSSEPELWLLTHTRTCASVFDDLEYVFGCHYFLPFSRVQLVMNKYYFGPAHGLPLSSLAGSFTNVKTPAFDIKHTWHPGIINGELYMLTTDVVRLNSRSGLADMQKKIWGRAIALERALAAMNFSVCRHVGAQKVPLETVQQLLCFKSVWDGDFDTDETSTASCLRCDTDYEVTVATDKETCESFVKIRAWRRFGACRSPECEVWRRAVTAGYKFAGQGLVRRLRPGAVRNRWEKDLRYEDVAYASRQLGAST